MIKKIIMAVKQYFYVMLFAVAVFSLPGVSHAAVIVDNMALNPDGITTSASATYYSGTSGYYDFDTIGTSTISITGTNSYFAKFYTHVGSYGSLSCLLVGSLLNNVGCGSGSYSTTTPDGGEIWVYTWTGSVNVGDYVGFVFPGNGITQIAGYASATNYTWGGPPPNAYSKYPVVGCMATTLAEAEACTLTTPSSVLSAKITFPDPYSVVPNFSNWLVTTTGMNTTTTITRVGVIYRTPDGRSYNDSSPIFSTYAVSAVNFMIPKNSVLNLTTSTVITAMPYLTVDGQLVYGDQETFTITSLWGNLASTDFAGGSTTVSSATFQAAAPFYDVAPSSKVPVTGADVQQVCVQPTDWSGYLTFAICYGWNLITYQSSIFAQGTVNWFISLAVHQFPFSVPMTLYTDISTSASTTLSTTTDQQISITLMNCVPMCVATSSRTLVILDGNTRVPYIEDQWFLLQQYLLDFVLVAIIYLTIRNNA